MRYRILGPLEVEGAKGTLALGPPKQRALLGILLLHHGGAVSITALIDELWGETAPRTAEHSIHTYVSNLRGILGAGTLVTTANGYRIDLDEGDLDAAAFEGLAGKAGLAEGQGRYADAFQEAARAIGLWRGEPLADVELANGAHPLMVRLSELRLQAVERWAAAALRLGRADEVLAELERETLEHPLRESVWALRMKGLHAAGRDAEALRVYQHLRGVLGEEMGIEPSQELQALEDSLLVPDGDTHPTPAAIIRNPYKGLRPFEEGDAADFFGRQPLVRQLVEAVVDPGRMMVSVVGPSGSGKSSVVRAGLVPALKTGAVAGSESWIYVVAQPGPRPLEEVRSALAAVVGERGGSLAEMLASLDRRLLLVLDQFEEVFTQAPEEVTAFLDLLTEACHQPDVRLVVTLRADFYDRPLLHPSFGRAFATGVVHVHPLAAEQLAAAATGPAERVGVGLEPALVSELIRDVAARPGSLPLFQYALTEVFDRRTGNLLALSAYRATGGVAGALTRRADEVFEALSPEEQDAMRQVFFRLVTVGEGDQATRRRVTSRELHSLGLATADLDRVLERFAHHRLISIDRDPVDTESTVEVAHEALLTEWPRLVEWLAGVRTDLRRRGSLAAAREKWMREGGHVDFLLSGRRLDQYEEWANATNVALSADERGFLDRSVAVREEERAVVTATEARRRGQRRRAMVARWAMVVAVVALAVVGVLILAPRLVSLPQVGVVTGPGGDLGITDLFAVGVTRVEQRHDLDLTRVTALIDAAEEVREMCRSGVELVLVGLAFLGASLDPNDPVCANTMILLVDVIDAPLVADGPNLATLVFHSEEGSYLAGAAAGLTTRSGVVGFVGVIPEVVTPFLAGYEAGVHAVDPDIEVLAVWTDHFSAPALGQAAAESMLAAGADVIYHAAGATGQGVLAAVAAANQATGAPVWYLGVDVDEALTAPVASRPFVLTSMLKRLDIAVMDAVDAFMNGELDGGIRSYGLANQGVDLTTTAGNLESILPQIEELRSRLIAGDISLTPWEIDNVTVLPSGADHWTHVGTLTFASGRCVYAGPTSLTVGDVLNLSISGQARTFVGMTAGRPVFSTDPIPADEPPETLEVDSVQFSPAPLNLPLAEGTWWVGCFTPEFAYPATAIEVTAP